MIDTELKSVQSPYSPLQQLTHDRIMILLYVYCHLFPLTHFTVSQKPIFQFALSLHDLSL